MDWDQIESKWAAMTRRVRNDLPAKNEDALSTTQRSKAKDDEKAGHASDMAPNLPGDLHKSLNAQ